MKPLIKLFETTLTEKIKTFVLSAVIIAAMPAFTSCGDDDDDDPEPVQEETSATDVSDNDLIGEWMLVKDVICYSEKNAADQDVTIAYKGNGSPYYRFFEFTSNGSTLTLSEKTVEGYSTGATMTFNLKNNKLYSDGGVLAGTIENYDLKHSWDNLRIKWVDGFSHLGISESVISTYARKDW